jgi:hypothetical protein
MRYAKQHCVACVRVYEESWDRDGGGCGVCILVRTSWDGDAAEVEGKEQPDASAGFGLVDFGRGKAMPRSWMCW